MAKRIMIQGTMSGAGKSLLTAALCRIFRQDGYRVAPFKSQNMSLNSYITADGKEMGRAQVLQAQAAGKDPDVRMNPILLKPSGDMGSQVIVNGEVRGDYRAADYFRMKRQLIPDILEAWHSLEAENDILVIEGAGSPAEINLKQDDIVNMGLAEMVDAPVILVGDIDPGGVFAQIYGTTALLTERERKRIAGTVINKFRGDVEILRPGLGMLEELTGVPVLGVVPWMKNDLDDEDSLSPRFRQKERSGELDVAVIRLPRISNFTDFAPLERHPAVGVRYVASAGELGHPDLLILPGTKNTMEDLAWLRAGGWEAVIRERCEEGMPVLGICGGYQMLGRTIRDPEGAEHGGEMPGLGLIPAETVFARAKVQTQTGAAAAEPFAGARLQGYQIHMGRTETAGGHPFCTLEDGKPEGYADGQVFGTYLHGLFDTGELTEALAAWLLRRKGQEAETVRLEAQRDYLERQLDQLADVVRQSLNIDRIYNIMEEYCGSRPGTGAEPDRESIVTEPNRESTVTEPDRGSIVTEPDRENTGSGECSGAENGTAPGSPAEAVQNPAEIERRSMSIITQELARRGISLPEDAAPVIRRVIHTTADFDYTDTLFFSPDAVRRGVEALMAGTMVVTDTHMALSGVSRPGLTKLGAGACCYMSDPEVAEAARARGITRAAVSVERAAAEHSGCIFAAGNAPTALLALIRQMEAGFRPALVIAVPVGFVNVVEAKEAVVRACTERDIPVIAAMGRKGGSTVAAAILNALIYLAADMQEPDRRR